MGDVTYLQPQPPTLPFSPVPPPALPPSLPPSAEEEEEEEAPLAALFLRSIHLRRNIESQEFIHAGMATAVAVVDPPASCLPVASQTDRQRGRVEVIFTFISLHIIPTCEETIRPKQSETDGRIGLDDGRRELIYTQYGL